MGALIMAFAEQKSETGYKLVPNLSPFEKLGKAYGVYSFLADVRNNSGVTPIVECRGVPEDSDLRRRYDTAEGDYSASYLTLEELLAYDYDQVIEDRSEGSSGGKMTLREFLGEGFFDEIKRLQENRVDRIVFWFY